MANKQKIRINQVREKIAHDYKDRLNQKDQQIQALAEENKNLRRENRELKEKITAAEELQRMNSEWLERMQEYVNMTPEEMENVRKSLASSAEMRKTMSDAARVFGFMESNLQSISPVLSSIFGLFDTAKGEDR